MATFVITQFFEAFSKLIELALTIQVDIGKKALLNAITIITTLIIELLHTIIA